MKQQLAIRPVGARPKHPPARCPSQIRGCHFSPACPRMAAHRGEHIVTISGTRNADRIAENAGAVNLLLSTEDPAHIAEILPIGSYGSRCRAKTLPHRE